MSSGDEGPWPSSSFGSLPQRRDSSVPGLPGNIWAQGPRGSFSGTANAAQAMYSVRGSSKGRSVGAPPSVVRSVSTPSPANSDGSGQPAFTNMPLQPTPKAVRSMSHSHGQQEIPHKPLGGMATGSQPAALPLGLLAEEVDTETESEGDLGESLTHSMSNPLAVNALQRTSTYPLSYGFTYGASNGKEGEGDYFSSIPTAGKPVNRLENASNVTYDPSPRRPQWHTSLGWDDLPSITESRRHSLADIPTRRGSVAGEQQVGAALNDINRGAHDLVRANTLDEGT
ncbi:hypothetical protein K431DRAFT_297051 [Polychaeton citri CBS 116435]|uniref:Uncharacterized protein n=1 Tax=Polychaeton citri CBS 116435 TaxID=1314669 RepID=A0A9P4UJS2_9PEZI|nr:hypothetical protein K431DRAFT_297051 [Polychaeton citri CBS 116435]